MQLFSNQVGIGSSTYDFDGDLEIIFRTSSQLIAENSDNRVPVHFDVVFECSVWSMVLASKSPRILLIFSEKNFTKRSESSFAHSWVGNTTFFATIQC